MRLTFSWYSNQTGPQRTLSNQFFFLTYKAAKFAAAKTNIGEILEIFSHRQISHNAVCSETTCSRQDLMQNLSESSQNEVFTSS